MNQQIHEEDGDIIEMSRRDANQLIPSVESAYVGLQIQGKYLPKHTSSIINAEYLMKVLFDEVYVPQTEDIKIGVLQRKVKKEEVIEELLKIELDQDQEWGIDLKHQPDKQWAVNVLKTLKPDSDIFKKYTPSKYDMKNFTKEQLQKIRELDITQGKKGSARRFFRIPKEKQHQVQQQKKQEQKRIVEMKIKRKKNAIQEVQKDIQVLDQKIQQI